MRALALFAVAGAAAEASQQGHIMEHIHAPAMIPRDDCTDLPKLCTDPVLLRGHETTLTYLCPETEGPSTVTATATTTRTITVTVDLTSSVPVVATSDSQTPVIEEPTTTETVKSTTQVTVTKFVTRVTASTTSSSLSPPTITWSFTAIPPGVGSTPVSSVKAPTSGASSSFGLSPSHVIVSSSSVASTFSTPTSSASGSLEHFPTYVIVNSSSIASTSSVATLPSLGIHRPIYWNHTMVHHTGGHHIIDHPTLNVVRDAEAKSTETVTTTAAIATENKKGQAGDTQASFIALFFGVLAATLLI
ncbi:hypothetical protein AG0111_0g9078 [Alternaria gaisen]|uniref:Uncharacterized protein n=1 Tax=Alternaria gaisen TaxID=167740 RepID=A0ACB6FDX8_9PLEO|nr:hypothetical protein AG0111_0g9078 [Alternaria gaisen]